MCETMHDVSDLAGTRAVAASVAAMLAPEGGRTSAVVLEGPLGAGKTTFAREVVEALGLRGVAVTSPSFALVNVYRGEPTVYHVDLYRVTRPSEVEGLDLEDLLDDPKGVTIVEWPEPILDLLPRRTIRVRIDFSPAGETARRITLTCPP
jgi:tRNA threonylcarbamoyladenosine biosynthesis protein TsaE